MKMRRNKRKQHEFTAINKLYKKYSVLNFKKCVSKFVTYKKRFIYIKHYVQQILQI